MGLRSNRKTSHACHIQASESGVQVFYTFGKPTTQILFLQSIMAEKGVRSAIQESVRTHRAAVRNGPAAAAGLSNTHSVRWEHHTWEAATSCSLKDSCCSSPHRLCYVFLTQSVWASRGQCATYDAKKKLKIKQTKAENTRKYTRTYIRPILHTYIIKKNSTSQELEPRQEILAEIATSTCKKDYNSLCQ